MPPERRWSRPLPGPPNIMAQRPMLAAMVTAPAIVAATELMRMSRFIHMP
jgi:hypothetical protein